MIGAASRHTASSSRPSIDGACAAREALAVARAPAADDDWLAVRLGVAVCAARHDVGATTSSDGGERDGE